MKTAHTPTPYRYEAMDNQYGYRIYAGEKQKLRIVATCTAPHGGAGIETMTPKAKANAAFIVRAVNSHDELVSILQKLTDNAKKYTGVRIDSIDQLFKEAEAILAKAKGDA